MKKYGHIGYPKNFSTSLQRSFFGLHEDIYHLGIGSDQNIGYIDNLTSSIFEVYLKSAKCFKYESVKEKLKTHISYHYNKAKSQNKKCFGVSSEHLSFGFTHDCLDFKTRIDRLIDLFGKEDFNIILIIRSQSELIKSLYRESVRVGFSGSYSDYLYNIYKFQDRNYIFDFRYDIVLEYLQSVLPNNNIHTIIFEDCRNERGVMTESNGKVNLIKEISEILGVTYESIDFKHSNKALSTKELIIKSELNKEKSHDLGREMTFAAEIHRQYPYFSSELNITEEEHEIYEDVITKRKLIEIAKKEKTEINVNSFYEANDEIKNWLQDFFLKGNESLSKILKKELPNSYFELNF